MRKTEVALVSVGIICLMFGLCLSITSGVLANEVPIYTRYNDGSTSTYFKINSHYWGGVVVSITK